MDQEAVVDTQEQVEVQAEPKTDFLTMAREAYESSTSYYNASLRGQWERNIYNFMSRHAPGSKYHTPAYASRSRYFRPKTRSAVRQNEAAAVAAFFSTQDVVSIEAEAGNNPEAEISAKIQSELTNYRLTGTSIPWFKIVIGGYQDAQVMGVCCARAGWRYQEKPTGQERLVGTDGEGNLLFEPVSEIVIDRPEIKLIAAENLRIHPAADWLDPVGTSPYIIELIPMHIKDVLAEMKKIDPKTGEGSWKTVDATKLLTAATTQAGDPTRYAREGGKRQDPKDVTSGVDEHTIVWIHRVIMDVDGEDMLWYTLGVTELLTDPVPLKTAVLHGMRDYVFGTCAIEAHKPFPTAMVELGQDLQASANDLANQRFDNIKLALNQRSFVRRAASVDLRALKRSVPGGLVMVSNLDKDVKPIDVRDVTSSSYAEQDRLSMDFDEVLGAFSQSSVVTNRKIGETVGGMNMVKDNANTMTEYQIRTYAETFIEPLLRHLVSLIREYETDQKILQLAADRAGLPAETPVTLDMLKYAVEVTVDVGYGATDPARKLQKFGMAVNTVAAVPGLLAKLEEKKVVDEVFGAAGFKNGSKFFKALGEEAQAGPSIEQQELELRKYEIDVRAKVDMDTVYAKIAVEREIKLSDLYETLGIKSGELDLKQKDHDLRLLQESGRRREQQLKEDELRFKASTGRDGI